MTFVDAFKTDIEDIILYLRESDKNKDTVSLMSK